MPYGKGIANHLNSAYMKSFKFEYNSPEIIDGYECHLLETSVLVEMDNHTTNVRMDQLEDNANSKMKVFITDVAKCDLHDLHNIAQKITDDFPSGITIEPFFLDNDIRKGYILSYDEFHIFERPGVEVKMFKELPKIMRAYATFEIKGIKRKIESGKYYIIGKLLNYKMYHPWEDIIAQSSKNCCEDKSSDDEEEQFC
jgi:hypothetical protein